MFLYRAADFERAFHRGFRCVVKYQRHPVAGWNRNQPMVGFRFAELFSAADNLVQQLEQAALLINQQLGVADNVDEEHIGDLELNLFFNLRGHGGDSTRLRANALHHSFGASEATIFSKRGSPRRGSQ